VSGICAEGGFEVGITWEQKKVTTATVKSKSGMPCTLKNPMFSGAFFVVNAADNSAVTYTRSGDSITFDTSAGAIYRIGAGAGP
jgi:alpha-L-fucosidase 2